MTEKNSNSFFAWLSKPEALVGLSAVVISVVAVAVSAYEARIMREWQRAAVWPYVQLSRSFYYDPKKFEATGEYDWTLLLVAENVGVGPAQVKDFRVTVNGEPHENWGSAMEALIGDDAQIQYGQSTINGSILPAGQKMQMFQFNDSALAKRIYDSMDELNLEACFCSVFGECWRTTYRGFGVSTKVDSCKPDSASFRE